MTVPSLLNAEDTSNARCIMLRDKPRMSRLVQRAIASLSLPEGYATETCCGAMEHSPDSMLSYMCEESFTEKEWKSIVKSKPFWDHLKKEFSKEALHIAFLAYNKKHKLLPPAEYEDVFINYVYDEEDDDSYYTSNKIDRYTTVGEINRLYMASVYILTQLGFTDQFTTDKVNPGTGNYIELWVRNRS